MYEQLAVAMVAGLSNETHPFLRMIDDDMKMLALRRAF